MSRSATTAARTVLPRYFSTVVARGGAASDASLLRTSVYGGATTFFGSTPKAPQNTVDKWMKFEVIGSRNASSVALGEKQQEEEKVNGGSSGSAAPSGGDANDKKEIASYWGVERAKITKEDGSEWKWNCFRVRQQKIERKKNVFCDYCFLIYSFIRF